MTTQRITVFVDDNYHYQDEDERYQLGNFDTIEAAITACQRLVDEYLEEARGDSIPPIASAADLYQGYTMFGPDPFVVGAAENVPFSAWKYAEQRCQEIFSTHLPSTSSGPESDMKCAT